MSSTVCLTDTSVIPFPSKDFTYASSSNTAGRPLPHIPRRLRPSPTGHGHSLSDSHLSRMQEPSSLTSANPSPNPPLPPSYESDSSSSSTSSDGICPAIVPRPKNTQSQHPHAQHSTETTRIRVKDSRPDNPSRDWSDDDIPPQSLVRISANKCALDEPTPKHVSEPRLSTPVATLPPVSPSETRTVRKKSGELVRPSLKRRPQLSVATGGASAKSAPATPTPTKAVHFDSKLEHVKLFLAEQKPLAVSRDGSPNSDTSGTDDFSSFAFGSPPKAQKQVKMSVRNMPPTPRTNEDVALQELTLLEDQRTLLGKVRVRNIAYEKWLAARFTTDWWQTTSEVAARYEKSVDNGTFDIFAFFIRLHDIWNRIEDKSLFVALRYVAGGRECWDNNGGQNYHVKFVANPLSDRQSGTVGNASNMSMNDLKMRLEEVARTKAPPSAASTSRVQASFSGSYASPLSSLKSLSQRYDFGPANKWKLCPMPRHARTQTCPAAGPCPVERNVTDGVESKLEELPGSSKEPPPSTPSSSPVISKETPSLPRVSDTVKTGDSAALTNPPGRPHRPQGRSRNHMRGYVDHATPSSPTVMRTPPGLPRLHSYPFAKNSLSMDSGLGRLKSDSPAPPTPHSSVAQEDEGTGSAEISPMKPSTPADEDVSGASQGDAYKQFVSQYCFYTGSDSRVEGSTDIFPRLPPNATFEQYLFSRSPPAHMFSPHALDLATFGPTQRSGTVTPPGPSVMPIAG
ncbi:putative phosphatase regulatory subunit-domain-containing protein [Pisolithus marmoratus]|nr:putative phosphatase regulatory subunit-domain-containing protein [Pisolithus marmoratus]